MNLKVHRNFFVGALLFFLSCDDSENEDLNPIDPSISSNVGVINDEFEGLPIVVYANGGNNTLVAFQRQTNLSSEVLDFSVSANNSSGGVFMDQNGKEYDLNGKLLGEEEGEVYLKQIDHVVGYWFFFPAVYNEITLYDGTKLINTAFSEGNSEWLIDTKFIFAGSFRDGIPSIDDPKFVVGGKELIDHDLYSSLNPSELVTVVQIDRTTRVYPHRILEYHEVVNDVIGDTPLTVSYCPLTGTSFAWDRTINGKVVEFGVSGLLYNNNLILYDRTSESNWSQILGTAVSGLYRSDKVKTINMFETTLKFALGLPGSVEYLDTNTGTSYNYFQSLYPEYKTNSQVSFPLSNTDASFNAKERVLGIVIGNKVKVFSFSDF